MRWTLEEVDAHQRRINGDRDNNRSGRVPANESTSLDACKDARAFTPAVSPVVVRFTHYRKRLADADAFIGKWFLDGIVKAGLLHDDSAKYVEEVRHRQVKIEQWEDERCVIDLIPLASVQAR